MTHCSRPLSTEQKMYLELLSALESKPIPKNEPTDVPEFDPKALQAAKIDSSEAFEPSEQLPRKSEEPQPPGEESRETVLEKVTTVPPPIFSLPTELIQDISRYLQVEFQVYFSLSCKRIQNALGTKCWADSALRKGILATYGRGDEARRIGFLNHLARDLPNWEYCQECRVLHPPLSVPAKWRPNRPLKSCVAGGIIDYHPQSGEAGYVILLQHIRLAFEQARGSVGDPIPLMSAAYSIEKIPAGLAFYDVFFAARKRDRDLILKTSHVFETTNQFDVTDILDLPLRICPHLTTSTSSVQYSDHGRWKCNNKTWTKTQYNSSLLTFAVASAITKIKSPAQLKRLLGTSRKFREPTHTELNQMTAEREENDFWWCRSCPTKFQLKKERAHSLVLNVWQNFGPAVNEYRWNALVRKTDMGLKQNWEFGCISRSFGDFEST